MNGARFSPKKLAGQQLCLVTLTFRYYNIFYIFTLSIYACFATYWHYFFFVFLHTGELHFKPVSEIATTHVGIQPTSNALPGTIAMVKGNLHDLCMFFKSHIYIYL